MFRHHSNRRADDRYRQLSARLLHAEETRAAAQRALVSAQQAEQPLSEIRTAYNTIGAASQEPLPAEPAIDPRRPQTLTRQLSRLRTLRQCYLLDAPPGVLAPASVQPTSRAAYGPHVPGLDFGIAVEPGSPYERRWGVNLAELLDSPSRLSVSRNTTTAGEVRSSGTTRAATHRPKVW